MALDKNNLNSQSLQADGYRKSVRKRLATGFFLLATLFAIAFYSTKTGSFAISLPQMWAAMTHGAENEFRHVLLNIRLPRTTAAVLAGAVLSVAGVIMQNVLKNPLASPFTLGISQGAAFGAAIAIILGSSLGLKWLGKAYTVSGCALMGSLLAMSAILAVSWLKVARRDAVILAGVAISAFFSASIMFLQYFASDVQVSATIFWQFGDLNKAGWTENALIAAVFLVSNAFFWLQSWNYNALSWGDLEATSLGVRAVTLRILSIFFACVSVSIVTAFLGVIGFIGLMAPHITRFLTGSDHRFLIPYSAMTGAILLLVSDVLARTILSPAVLPVGIVTSFIGAPIFLWLLIRKNEQ